VASGCAGPARCKSGCAHTCRLCGQDFSDGLPEYYRRSLVLGLVRYVLELGCQSFLILDHPTRSARGCTRRTTSRKATGSRRGPT
jgi:hypothetical protein